MDEVRILSIEDDNGWVFSATSLPAPLSVLQSLFPEIAGVQSEEEFYKQSSVAPIPSLLLSSDSICQLTDSKEVMAIARYFRSVALQLKEYEEWGEGFE